MTLWTCTGKQKVFFKKSYAAFSDTYSLNSYFFDIFIFNNVKSDIKIILYQQNKVVSEIKVLSL